MKIECVKNKISDAISKAEKITGKNLSLPILSSIAIETKNSSILIRSTNLDLGLELEVPVKVIESGKVAVQGNILSSFFSNLSDEEKITLETTDSDLFIHTGKTSTRIKLQPFEEFPIIPKIPDKKTTQIVPSEFVKGLKSVWYSAAVSSIKPELSSVYIYFDGEESLVFVATDSFRLAEKKVKVKKGKDIGQVLIPFKNIPEIIRVLEGAGTDVSVGLSANQISFSWDGAYLTSRVIDGSFPDYKQIIPKEFKTEAVLLKSDLVNALKIANVFSDSFNQIVMKLIPNDKLFEISTQNSNVGESHNSIDAVIKGDNLTISFNYKYIVDSFQSIDSDSVTLFFTGLGKPMLIQGVSDRSFRYLVMPMNK